ncbi:hypothetical protein GOBAR_AA31986 [Gossypium barbadense]|uniref:Uncharacterized protein n=1 Tax=Gossypium barbadense TaxID=3634 RepID=A0A2P5WC91_GOSBA|nr:hypothetical protein GOBAR_AA31986 [Gossypium barbadense]
MRKTSPCVPTTSTENVLRATGQALRLFHERIIDCSDSRISSPRHEIPCVYAPTLTGYRLCYTTVPRTGRLSPSSSRSHCGSHSYSRSRRIDDCNSVKVSTIVGWAAVYTAVPWRVDVETTYRCLPGPWCAAVSESSVDVDTSVHNIATS